MTALYGRVLMGHNVNQLDASLVSELWYGIAWT
jgi:hypothetical protein